MILKECGGPGMARRFLEGTKALPDNFNDSLKEVYDRYLSEAILSETLVNLGVPEGKVTAAIAQKPIREMSQLIFEVIKESAGTKTYDIQNNPMPEKTSSIRFTELLLSLVDTVEEPKKFEAAYEKFGFESDSSKYLLDSIKENWEKSAPKLIEVLGVKSPKALLRHSVKWNNRDRPMLYRDVLRESTGKVEAYAKSNPGQPLSNAVNELVTEVLEGSQPKLGGMDTSKYIPIRKLRSSGGTSVLEVYNSETDTVERKNINLERAIDHGAKSCRRSVK